MKNGILTSILVVLVLGVAATIPAEAQIRPYRVTDVQVRNLLRQIESKTDVYQRQMNTALDRGRLNGTETEEQILAYITEFENATDVLRRRVETRGAIYNEVNDVLTRATYIDQMMRRNTLTPAAQRQWMSLRTDLNTLARYYNVRWSWNQTLPTLPGTGVGFPSDVNEVQVRNLLTRIETRTDTFRDTVTRALDRSPLNNTRREDNIAEFITGFENATDELRRNFDSRRNVSDDVNEVLTRAAYIDQFMGRNTLTRPAENQWITLRSDLNQLANLYSVSWNWNRTLPPYPGSTLPGGNFPGGSLDSRLTGTYRLNTALSENVSTAVDRVVDRYYTGTQRDEALRQRLERRLASPQMIAIEKRGRSVTMASTNSPQITFDIDGVARTETNDRGRTTRITATSESDGFAIDYVGDRANDFYVDFSSAGNNQLRVSRRLYLENRNETITVVSVYDKIDSYARWSDVVSGTVNDTTGVNTPVDFYIPNGTRLTAVLRNNINTKDSQVGDRFTMEVTSPNQYRGAIIEGRITGEESSGRLTGRASMSFDFDTIRMTDGRTYRFAGLIDSVRSANGDNVSVNNEGAVRDSNQTTRTVTRAGIGAAIGAIIGAIAGGGQGAAIGAAVGAGAGAGTVLIQGRDNIDLGTGSEFSITATAPANVVGARR